MTPFPARPRQGWQDDLFPPAFLRLLGAVPTAVRRLAAGSVEGRRAVPGEGGRFLFRGHREYRPGDDLRRIDWKVAARLGRHVVRQFDAERDVATDVWLDGSASMAPLGGRVKAARAAALAAAVGLATGGRLRLGVLREGTCEVRVEASQPGQLPLVLRALEAEVPGGRAGLATALARLVRMVPRHARVLLVSDLLTRTDPGVLHGWAGRGVRGGLLHLRVPESSAPAPMGTVRLRDAETGDVRVLRLDAAAAARVAQRAREHADRWAAHAASVGFRYLPFAPSTPDEALLRRLVEAVP